MDVDYQRRSDRCNHSDRGADQHLDARVVGARPAQVGILTAVAFWAQLLQGPGVLLIERLRMRKLIAIEQCENRASEADQAIL